MMNLKSLEGWREKIMKKIRSNILHDIQVKAKIPINIQQPFSFVSSLTKHSGQVKELSIFITMLKPFHSRFLLPVRIKLFGL